MITQATIEDIKRIVSVPDVLGLYGAKVVRNMCCCPIHQEKTPSLHVYRGGMTYKCFGCGASGDIFSLVTAMDKKPFNEAAEFLAEKFNIEISYDHQTAEQTKEKRNEKEQAIKLMSWAQKQFTKCLASLSEDHPVIQFLEKRGIARQTALARGYGYGGDINDMIVHAIIESGAFALGKSLFLINNGLHGNYDRYSKRITIPIYNTFGQVIGFGGRTFDPKVRAKYINPSDNILYQKARTWYGLETALRSIANEKFVYVVEGYMDADSLKDAGVDNVVAPCGTAITNEQLIILRRHTNEVCLMLDNDTGKEVNTGQNKMLSLITELIKHKFQVSIVELPEGQDPDEFVRTFEKQQSSINV